MCEGPIVPDAPPAAIGGRRERSQCVSRMRLGVPVWSPAVFATQITVLKKGALVVGGFVPDSALENRESEVKMPSSTTGLAQTE